MVSILLVSRVKSPMINCWLWSKRFSAKSNLSRRFKTSWRTASVEMVVLTFGWWEGSLEVPADGSGTLETTSVHASCRSARASTPGVPANGAGTPEAAAEAPA